MTGQLMKKSLPLFMEVKIVRQYLKKNPSL